MRDVLIFGGQSNMQGQSEQLIGAQSIPGAEEYKWLGDCLVPLRDPVGEDVRFDRTPGYAPDGSNIPQWLSEHGLGSACYGHSTLVPKFCESYIRVTGARLTAIHAAKGSTCIKDWLPGTVGFEMLIGKAAAGLKKTKETDGVGRVFFIWLQGESDAISGNAKRDYKEKLRELNQALREKIGIEGFGIIRVGRFTNDERDREIIEAQDEICREDAGFWMLTRIATDLNKQSEFMHPKVKGHYSAKGLEALGEAAGKALGEYRLQS